MTRERVGIALLATVIAACVAGIFYALVVSARMAGPDGPVMAIFSLVALAITLGFILSIRVRRPR